MQTNPIYVEATSQTDNAAVCKDADVQVNI